MPDTTTTPGIGHNLPPDTLTLLRSTLAEADAEALKLLIPQCLVVLEEHAPRTFTIDLDRQKQMHRAGDVWLGRTAIADEEQAAKAVNFVAVMDREVERLEEEKKAVSPAFFNAHRRVTGYFNQLTEPLTTARKHVDKLMRGWLSSAKVRQEEDAAAKLAESARAAQAGDAATAASYAETAAAIRAGVPRVRTEHGALASGKAGFEIEVLDPVLVPREYLVPSMDLLRMAVEKRGLRNIPGVRITAVTKTSYRKS